MSTDTKTLFVKGISFCSGKEQVEQAFSEIGPIRSCFLVKRAGEAKHKVIKLMKNSHRKLASRAGSSLRPVCSSEVVCTLHLLACCSPVIGKGIDDSFEWHRAARSCSLRWPTTPREPWKSLMGASSTAGEYRWRASAWNSGAQAQLGKKVSEIRYDCPY